MTMKEFDGIVKGVIAASILGMGTWVMKINADVQVNKIAIKHNSDIAKEQIIVNKELTKAINDLRVTIASKSKD